MQQSSRGVNINSTRMLSESQVPKNSRCQVDDMMQQATMRKVNSSIQILQRIVSNKENNKEIMNMNNKGDQINDKKMSNKNFNKI